ncbi:hydroxysteroid (20-beta) dehydrogenase 2 [Latimeria chalumnae]|uniref:hydroxysteroid (20-beta) dehydrogenase 2 n=1 Tax=Latimeria chalumnae TaxID=7897 RepID=UPI00313DFCE4
MADSCCSDPSTVLTCLGALTLLYLCLKYGWKTLNAVRIHILSEFWRVDLKSYGEWAVVTGATAGIGKAYAEELAKRGLNVVLISRSVEKLKRVAAEIESRHGKKTLTLQADFTAGSWIYEAIELGLRDLNIGILVNNVGMAYPEFPGCFLNAPKIEKGINDLLNCNVLSVIQMTRIVLPQMIERKKGVIINLSSESGAHPLPMMTMYSASKVFVDFFSQGLSAEYQSKGIIIQSVMPLFVSTNMTHNLTTNVLVKKAEDFAREALNTVGLSRQTAGCLSHTIQHFLLDTFFPRWLYFSSFYINVVKAWNQRELQRRKELEKKE